MTPTPMTIAQIVIGYVHLISGGMSLLRNRTKVLVKWNTPEEVHISKAPVQTMEMMYFLNLNAISDAAIKTAGKTRVSKIK